MIPTHLQILKNDLHGAENETVVMVNYKALVKLIEEYNEFKNSDEQQPDLVASENGDAFEDEN